MVVAARTLRVGMTLTRPIHDVSGGTVLLQRGTQVTRETIKALERHGHMRVLCAEDMTASGPERAADPAVAVEAREALHSRAVKDSFRVSRRSIAQASEAVDDLASHTTHLDPHVTAIAQRAADDIMSTLMLSETAMRVLGQLAQTDDHTHAHSVRVSARAILLAAQYWTDHGFPANGGRVPLQVHHLTALGAGLILHDVGKLRVSRRILIKPGRLTSREYSIVKQHPADGFEMVGRNLSSIAGAVILHHHERWDGGGYPHGVAGERIPEAARIAAVSDVYDAIISERPYKQAMAPERGLSIIAEESGSMFDPRIVTAFLRVMSAPATALPRLDVPVRA
jgi:HD-GYP domain-containing protein (c-di-GMP phosphodiesterase class II)